MKFFLNLAGKTDYSTHVVLVVDQHLIHYTWSGVEFTRQDFLLEPVWTVEIAMTDYELDQVVNRATVLKQLLPKGFGHWWFKAAAWLFNRNQYLCTNFVVSCLGYEMKQGLSPDELYTWLNRV